jgi:hypothetical protein
LIRQTLAELSAPTHLKFDIDANPGRHIAVERLRQGDALQGNNAYCGLAE